MKITLPSTAARGCANDRLKSVERVPLRDETINGRSQAATKTPDFHMKHPIISFQTGLLGDDCLNKNGDVVVIQTKLHTVVNRARH